MRNLVNDPAPPETATPSIWPGFTLHNLKRSSIRIANFEEADWAICNSEKAKSFPFSWRAAEQTVVEVSRLKSTAISEGIEGSCTLRHLKVFSWLPEFQCHDRAIPPPSP